MGNTPGENKEGSSEQPHNSNDSAVKNIIDKSKAEIILLGVGIIGFDANSKEQRLELAKVSIDPAVLEALSFSKEYGILQALVLNEHTSIGGLIRIASSTDPIAKNYLIERIPNINAEVIQTILLMQPTLSSFGTYFATDINRYKEHRKMIIDNYADAMPASIKVLTEETKNRLWGYEGDETMEQLAKDPKISAEMLEDLAHIGSAGLWEAVALHPHINAATAKYFLHFKEKIDILSKRHDATVVQNSAFPEELYGELVASTSVGKYFFLLNPAIQEGKGKEIYNELIKGGLNDQAGLDVISGFDIDYPREVYDKIYEIGKEGILDNMLNNPYLPADILEKLSAHKSWKIRFQVATHKNTPKAILEALTKDKDKRVKGEAESSLAYGASESSWIDQA